MIKEFASLSDDITKSICQRRVDMLNEITDDYFQK